VAAAAAFKELDEMLQSSPPVISFQFIFFITMAQYVPVELNPHLIPFICFHTADGAPTAALKDEFWAKELQHDLGEKSVQALQGGLRLDKFLTIARQCSRFTDNLFRGVPLLRHLICVWLYFRTSELGHGSFEMGRSAALPLLWKVLPTCYEGLMILWVKGTTVDEEGQKIYGRLKTWRVVDDDLPAGSISLYGHDNSFTFKWRDIEEMRVTIPCWDNLVRYVARATQVGVQDDELRALFSQ
jgi:hypothetical protein